MRCKRRSQPETMHSGSDRWNVELGAGGRNIDCVGPGVRTGTRWRYRGGRAAQQAVGSMRLTGTLAVGPGGAVTGHVIDHADKVPPEVLRHVAPYVPRWRW